MPPERSSPEKKGHRKPKRATKAPKKTARCQTCGKTIRIPAGWSIGPAVRKHYWRVHREIMQKAGSEA